VHRIKSKSCAHPLPPLDAAYCRYGRRVASTGGGGLMLDISEIRAEMVHDP
jgi:hypothetical protein